MRGQDSRRSRSAVGFAGCGSALAFSIPKQPAGLDDGLLAESEIAQLKRCADGGSLACNTIAGEPPVAEPLRLAMLDDINEASNPGTRPAYWARFVVVGARSSIRSGKMIFAVAAKAR